MKLQDDYLDTNGILSRRLTEEISAFFNDMAGEDVMTLEAKTSLYLCITDVLTRDIEQ